MEVKWLLPGITGDVCGNNPLWDLLDDVCMPTCIETDAVMFLSVFVAAPDSPVGNIV